MMELSGAGAAREPLLERRRHDFVCGSVLLALVVALWVVSGVLTQRIFGQLQFDDPLFLTFVNAASFALFQVRFLVCGRPTPDVLSVRETNRIAIRFMPLWFALSYCYNWSLSRTTLSSTTILSSSAPVFALIFSLLLIPRSFTVTKVAGVFAAFAGACIVSLQDSEKDAGSSTTLGDMAALLSAALSGVYTVGLKQQVGSEWRRLSMSRMFGWMGTWVVGIGAPVLIVLHFSTLRMVTFPTAAAWQGLLLNALLSVFSDLLWAQSIVMTSPLIATVGLSMSIPLAMLCDFALKDAVPGALYALGSALVIAGFALVNVDHVRAIERRSTTPS
ncbi:EamA domain-containing protein [Plasmodiophora brassicae]|nr:hypothetical protein PBRA_000195 [Plasmodiophora brassicae]